MGSQVTGFDLTVPVKPEFGKNETMKFLVEWSKKWAFQAERAKPTDKNPDGYLHFQCRVSLFSKKRIGELIQQTKELLPAGHHWSITSTEVHKGQNFNYVMKADSREPGPDNGPWTDKDYEEPPVLTRQLREFATKTPHPWQLQCIAMAKELDDRSIKLIVDQHGDAGKSILAEKMEYDGIAYEIPPMRMMEDIMQCVQAINPKKCYLIDLPRGMKKEKLSDFYSGLESLKNGVSYDKRYSFKKRRMDRPQVIVFTNTYPDWLLMSADRWEVWDMQPDKSLLPHNRAMGEPTGEFPHDPPEPPPRTYPWDGPSYEQLERDSNALRQHLNEARAAIPVEGVPLA